MRTLPFCLLTCAASLLTASAATAQNWEAGALAGAAFAREVPISRTQAGFVDSPAAGIYLGQDVSRRFGGELRYAFRPGDPRLRRGDTEVVFAGESHLFHYDLLIYPQPWRGPVRPFLAAGGGVRITRGTGTEAAYQPLMEDALLTRARQIQPVVSLAAGIKFKLGRRLRLRCEFRDYLSPFPGEVITPASGAKAGRWLNDLVPMIGLGYAF